MEENGCSWPSPLWPATNENDDEDDDGDDGDDDDDDDYDDDDDDDDYISNSFSKNMFT